MTKVQTKQKILRTGAGLIHSRGFKNTGIKDILDSSGVPKGSFYFYFKSKEDFGVALIDYYIDFISLMMKKYMEDKNLEPVERLMRFFEDGSRYYQKTNFTCGCPIGNLSQEMSDLNEPMRTRLKAAYLKMRSDLVMCLKEAQSKKQIDDALDAENLGVFILNSWEGALIDMKVSKSIKPLEIFIKMVFEGILSTGD
jgi:TetR/AcrR family transcriptional regulator, transcriptional repressor for nem operon